MKKSILLAAASAIAVLAIAPASNAATIVVNQTLDLTQPKAVPGPGFQGWQSPPAFNGGYSVALAVGDTFDFTIDFLGAQTLTTNNLSVIWAFSYANGAPSTVDGTGTFSFLDAGGNAFLMSNSKSSSEGSVHFGQLFGGGDFAGGLPSSLTFSGVRYVGTLTGYDEPGLTTRDYDNPAFFLNADTATIGGAVPEPAAWALMLAGFGLVGGAMRRRQATVRVTYA